jgi:hypothetical protein
MSAKKARDAKKNTVMARTPEGKAEEESLYYEDSKLSREGELERKRS